VSVMKKMHLLCLLLALTGAGCPLTNSRGISTFEKKNECAKKIPEIEKDILDINKAERTDFGSGSNGFYFIRRLEKVCYVESIDSCISIETIAPSGDKNIKGSEVRYRSLLTGELLGSAQYWINESTELIDEGRALVAFAAEAERLEKEYACAD
jgi:hypothetical protein